MFIGLFEEINGKTPFGFVFDWQMTIAICPRELKAETKFIRASDLNFAHHEITFHGQVPGSNLFNIYCHEKSLISFD